jgi:prepilin-type N-terminal cleavage/methylation domain-containing protein
MRAHITHRSGFTLIELLIVMGMLGIITTVVLVAINPTKQLYEARSAERAVLVREQENALMHYVIDRWEDPAPDIPLGEGNAKPICRFAVSNIICVNIDGVLSQDYLVAIPVDRTQTGTLITGYRIYKDQSGRPHVCSDFLPIDNHQRCSGSTSMDILGR